MSGGDYSPIDLAAYCNAGLDALGQGASAPAGSQQFHGLPFQIGTPEGTGKCLMLLGRTSHDRPAIWVGRTARRIIFVHRLLDTKVYEGGPVGVMVAEYVIHYEGGLDERVPIRERFEIGIPDERWTQHPFLAWADQDYRLPPRFGGRWEDSGLRQTEAAYDWKVSYYLFPWTNPNPDRTIRTIEIVPGGPRFILAAITLGQLDEDPLRRGGAREVLITLPQPADATAEGDLEVRVDRGLASFSHALPGELPAGSPARPMPGWGEPRNVRSSPRYVRVAAVPSASLAVTLGAEEVGRVGWSDLERDGRVDASARLRVELVDRGRNWVRTAILDDATGRPLPCRVHFRSPEGIPFAPHGHHAHVNSNIDSWHVDVGGDVRLGHATYAYTDGTCEGWLPRGEVIADIASGFEYEPLRTKISIAPGQQELELRLKRWTDMNAQGWFSGDTHVHFLSPQGGVFEARGEGLNVVNVLQAQWGSLFTNMEDFTGAPHVSGDGRTIVYTTQENRQHVMGHLGLLGLKKPLMPWSSDGLGEAELGGTLESTLSDWADRCHAQGGTVVIAHFPSPNGEPAVLIATGRADAIEMIRFGPYEHITYYRYLNAGYRLPLVGGTDKMSSDVPVGLYRTYVRIPPGEEFTYESWCRNLRRGQTFMSGGPIIHFSVDGHQIGETVSLPTGGGTVEVQASVESIFPVHVLEIIRDGEVVAATSEPAGSRRLDIREALHIDRNGWLAARAGGPGYWNPTRHNDEWNRGIAAHTSPVYVAVGGPWGRYDKETAGYMLTLISGGLEYVQRISPRYAADSVSHHHREPDHEAYLERPFREALAAVRARIEAHEKDR